MQRMFNKVKSINILKKIFRYLLGSLLFISGIILTILFDNYLYLFLGLSLTMIESVIVLASFIRKDKNKKKLLDETIKEIPFMKFGNSNKEITEIFNIFSYKGIFNSFEVINSMDGEYNGYKITSAVFETKVSSIFKKYYIRVYKITGLKNIKFDIYNFRHILLYNFKYEIKNNILYLSLVSNKKIGKLSTFEPSYFKNYDEFVDRFNLELDFIKSIINKLEG